MEEKWQAVVKVLQTSNPAGFGSHGSLSESPLALGVLGNVDQGSGSVPLIVDEDPGLGFSRISLRYRGHESFTLPAGIAFARVRPSTDAHTVSVLGQ